MKKFTILTFVLITFGISITSCGNSEQKTSEVETSKDSSKITQYTTGGYWLVGLEHAGTYAKITSKIDELQSYLKEKGNDSGKIVAIYFDDEAKVEEANLKSFAGFVVKDSAEAASLVAANPKFKMHSVAKKDGYCQEVPFTNWEDLIKMNGKIYNDLIAKIQESKGQLAASEATLEEYEKNTVRIIVRID